MITLTENNLIKIGKESMVLLPLSKWEALQETIDDLEDAIRFERVFKESRGQKLVSFEKMKKKYHLK